MKRESRFHNNVNQGIMNICSLFQWKSAVASFPTTHHSVQQLHLSKSATLKGAVDMDMSSYFPNHVLRKEIQLKLRHKAVSGTG